MPGMRVLATVVLLSSSTALAAEVIEAVGAERCGGSAKRYAVEFLAPEDAPLEASAKVMRAGREDVTNVPALSLDGKPCANARCAFRATKGQTYKLAAESTAQTVESLCISIARP